MGAGGVNTTATQPTFSAPRQSDAIHGSANSDALKPAPTWRDFTWIDGQRYLITERQRVDQWVPKPGQEGKRNPEMLHVAFMACRVEVA